MVNYICGQISPDSSAFYYFFIYFLVDYLFLLRQADLSLFFLQQR